MENLKHYGSMEAPKVPLDQITVPTAFAVGSDDLLANPQDAVWTAYQIGDAVVFYEEYKLGHLSFTMAEDMSWFTNDVMTLINSYNSMSDQFKEPSFTQ